MNDNSPQVKFNTSTSSDGVERNDGSKRNTRAASSDKNFKKILEKEDGGSEQETFNNVEGDEESAVAVGDGFLKPVPVKAKQTAPLLSPFDLSRNTNVKAESTVVDNADGTTPVVANNQVESPSKLFAKLNKDVQSPVVPSEGRKDSVVISEFKVDDEKKGPEAVVQFSSKKENYNNSFAQEQPDISYVNPLGIAAPQKIEALTPDVKVERSAPVISTDLRLLIDQLAKELTVVKAGDKSETIIELKYPPIFENARITVTSYGVKGEINVKFDNLTAPAQQLLDQQQNRADLMSSLERKGYNVHIFTTTTYDEGKVTANIETQEARKEQQQREGREGGSNKQGQGKQQG